MNSIFIFAVIVLIFLIYDNGVVSGFINGMNGVKECIDNRCYNISSIYETHSHKEAAELLDYVNRFSIKFLRKMRNKYLWDPSANQQLKSMTSFLLDHYNPDNLIENAPKTTVNTSYVEDKGRVFAVCLRERKTGKFLFHDKNLLEFVTLHEITHLSTPSVGHEQEFWIYFKAILKDAERFGMHTPVDYKYYPVNYCGLNINYNPYYDKNIPDIN